MPTDNNLLKTLYVRPLTDGRLEISRQDLLELVGVYTTAQIATKSSETKTNSSTTESPLYSPISDSPHGTTTLSDCMSELQGGPSYAPTVTELKQKENVESAQKLDVGLKHDSNKPPLAYIPKAALYAEGEAFAFGAKKYEPFNYRHGIAVTRTLGAALRHIVQFLEGEDNDSESGVNHLGCARANIAMALDTLANHPEMDDRFKGAKKK